jgi:hypothetical protein
VAPRQGRGFQGGEWHAGGERVVVIGDDLWRRAFGADAAILGRAVAVDGEPATVVGIAPPGFRFPQGAEIWAPLVVPAAGAPRDAHYLTVAGRLATGRTRAEAEARMALVAARLRADHPATNAERGIVVRSLSEGMEDPGVRPIFAVWQAAAPLVLALSGVYGVMAYRVGQRRFEFGVRLALGAAPRDILGLTLGQASRLTALGILIGLGLALALGRALSSAFVGVVRPDAASFAGFAALLALAALAAAAVPARRALAVDQARTLRSE